MDLGVSARRPPEVRIPVDVMANGYGTCLKFGVYVWDPKLRGTPSKPRGLGICPKLSKASTCKGHVVNLGALVMLNPWAPSIMALILLASDLREQFHHVDEQEHAVPLMIVQATDGPPRVESRCRFPRTRLRFPENSSKTPRRPRSNS